MKRSMPRLSPRDRKILNLLRLSPHTTSQLARLLFPNRKKASQRLRQLTAAGHLKRFSSPIVHPTGRPEFVYTAGRVPRSYHLIRHALQMSEVAVILHEWLTENPGFTGRAYWPRQLLLTGGIIPDGIFVVARDHRKLLFLVEVDRGTESKTGADYSVRRKLIAYGEYFDSGRFAEDYAMLGTFNSFRVVFVSVSELALPGLLRIAAETQTDFVYFKPMSKLTPKTFPESWATANQDRADLFGRTERQT